MREPADEHAGHVRRGGCAGGRCDARGRGENPLEREKLFQRIWRLGRRARLRCVGALDVALWDLAGKIMGQPVHALIGTYRRSAPAYASSAVLSSPQAYVDEALSFRERGWTAYKIHPPTQWQTDIRVCEAVRKAMAVGLQMPVILSSPPFAQ